MSSLNRHHGWSRRGQFVKGELEEVLAHGTLEHALLVLNLETVLEL
jgi:hypothetical protein